MCIRDRCFQVHCARFTAEGVEAGPGDVTVPEEGFRLIQSRPDVPGDKVYISAVEAGGSAGEGEHLRSDVYKRQA